MSQVPELTLPELLDQPWTKRLARAAAFVIMLMVTAGGAGLVAYFTSLGTRITAIETDRTARIIKSDQNTNNLQTKVSDLQTDMDRVRSDVTTVKVDLAEVKGILQQMRQEQVSAADHPPAPVPMAPMPILAVRSN